MLEQFCDSRKSLTDNFFRGHDSAFSFRELTSGLIHIDLDPRSPELDTLLFQSVK